MLVKARPITTEEFNKALATFNRSFERVMLADIAAKVTKAFSGKKIA